MGQQQAQQYNPWTVAAVSTIAFGSLATSYPLLLVPVAWAFLAVLLLAVIGRAFGGSGKARSPNGEQALQLVRQRRSIYPKDFTGANEGITQEKLQQMLEAARWAPTHKLTEPWHFVVLSGAAKADFEALTIGRCQALLPPEKAEQVLTKLKRKQAKDWTKVHCYIAICMKRHEEVPEWEEIAAVAAAVQNMYLVGTALGVSGYWSSWQAPARDSPEMHRLLQLDTSRGDRCLGVFVVGQADAERLAAVRPRRQPLEEKVLWKS